MAKAIAEKRQVELMELVMEASISLSEIHDFEALIAKMGATALEIGSCEGVSIYKYESNDKLSFVYTLNKRISTNDINIYLKDQILDIDDSTIAGHCAKSKRVLNIGDVYNLPADSQTRFNARWDMMMNYRSKSMLVIPMVDSQGALLGVLQLINHVTHGQVQSFPNALERFLKALANQCGIILRNAIMARELRQSRIEAVKKFVLTSEFHDPDTGGHIERMGQLSGFLYKKIGRNPFQVDDMTLASMLHDVGKIAIPDSVLKKPGALTAAEWDIMKTHAQKGYEILIEAESPLLQIGAIVAQSHHEKWDGSGYPLGLFGKDIPIEGRIVAITDVFDALCSKRCYKEQWPMEDVITHMRRGSGTHFDPELLELFISSMDEVLKIRERLLPKAFRNKGAA